MTWSNPVIKYLAAACALLAAVDAVAILPHVGNYSSCPGYKASNVQKIGNAIVGADLHLAGPACNAYGTDLDKLKLHVEYQTGTSRLD
jgi:alpha-glucosidase